MNLRVCQWYCPFSHFMLPIEFAPQWICASAREMSRPCSSFLFFRMVHNWWWHAILSLLWLKCRKTSNFSDLFHFKAFFRLVDSWFFNVQISWHRPCTSSTSVTIALTDDAIIFYVFDTHLRLFGLGGWVLSLFYTDIWGKDLSIELCSQCFKGSNFRCWYA